MAHQRKMHAAATERPQSRIDELQVQVTKLVQTVDCNRTATEGAGTVETRISRLRRPCSLLLANFPPPGTQVPDALRSALEKLRPANYPRMDEHHAGWYPSLLVLLTAWLARESPDLSRLAAFLCAPRFDA